MPARMTDKKITQDDLNNLVDEVVAALAEHADLFSVTEEWPVVSVDIGDDESPEVLCLFDATDRHVYGAMPLVLEDDGNWADRNGDAWPDGGATDVPTLEDERTGQLYEIDLIGVCNGKGWLSEAAGLLVRAALDAAKPKE